MKLSDIFKLPIKLRGGGILNLKGFNKSIIDKEVGGGSDFPYNYIISDKIYTASEADILLGHINIDDIKDKIFGSIYYRDDNKLTMRGVGGVTQTIHYVTLYSISQGPDFKIILLLDEYNSYNPGDIISYGTPMGRTLTTKGDEMILYTK